MRFDRDYPYGDKADAFKALAQTAVGAKVIIGTVGISTYGEKMNQAPGSWLVDVPTF